MLTDDFTINILLSQVMEREWWKNNYVLLPSHIYLDLQKSTKTPKGLLQLSILLGPSSALEEGITKVNQNADTRHVSKGLEEVYEARIRLTVTAPPPPEKYVWKTKLSSTEKQFCRQEVDEISDRRDELRRETLSLCLVGRWGMTRWWDWVLCCVVYQDFTDLRKGSHLITFFCFFYIVAHRFSHFSDPHQWTFRSIGKIMIDITL